MGNSPLTRCLEKEPLLLEDFILQRSSRYFVFGVVFLNNVIDDSVGLPVN